MAQTVLEIKLNALAHNYHYLRSKLQKEVKMMGVVKAYAYGSDAAAVSIKLVELGIDYLAVAYVKEGIALREAGIKVPVLVLHPQIENFEALIEHCLEPNIYSFRVLDAFIETAKSKNQLDYPIHIKFNTGLNRLGFSKGDEDSLLVQLKESKAVKVASLFSHLVASEDFEEKEFSLNQIADFKEITQNMIAGLGYKPFLHQSNTSGIINYPEAQFDLVRAGIGLYGYGNSKEESSRLIPIASLKTVISQIHEIKAGETVGYNRAYRAKTAETIATLPIGHADGISRLYGNGKGYVIVNGQKAPFVGNICMDMVMINITHIPCVEGDEVLIFGPDLPAEELAESISTIAYELITSISQRVERKILT